MGIRATLVAGLLLQIGGLGMLFYGWDDAWSKAEAIVYVTLAQALAGVKDLTKLGGKTVTKLTLEEKQESLFKLGTAVSPGTRTRSRAPGTSWAPRCWMCRTSRPFT